MNSVWLEWAKFLGILAALWLAGRWVSAIIEDFRNMR